MKITVSAGIPSMQQRSVSGQEFLAVSWLAILFNLFQKIKTS